MPISDQEIRRILVPVPVSKLAQLDAFIAKRNDEELARRAKGKGRSPILKREHVLRAAIERAIGDIGRKR